MYKCGPGQLWGPSSTATCLHLVRGLSALTTDVPTPSLFSLANRTIIVTGGARGLGFTIAEALLESGADVVCFDLIPTQDDWDAAVAKADANHQLLTYVKVDVTDAEGVEDAVKAAFAGARESHPVRGVLNSAGIQFMKAAEEISAKEWRKVLDVNLTGSWIVSAAFARAFFAQREKGVKGDASIALVASMSGRVANRGLDCAVYNASKAGVAQLARNLAMEWGTRGIRVNSLSPGYVSWTLAANPDHDGLDCGPAGAETRL